MLEFAMPSLGADMEAGTLVEWNVRPGDRVQRGQVVAVVETQKGAIDVEIWQDGIVERLVVEPGTKVPVGMTLALLRSENEREGTAIAATPVPPTRVPPMPASPLPVAPAPVAPAPVTSVPVAPAPVAAAPVAPAPVAPAPVGPAPIATVSVATVPMAATPAELGHEALITRVRSTPSARRLADELGIDVDSVPPSAPGAPISREDVERAAGERAAGERAAGERAAGERVAAPAPASPREDWRDAMRQAIAAAMSRSKREIPHYYLATEIDMTPTLAWLAGQNARRPVAQRLLPAVPLMKCVALALREAPALNGTWVDGRFVAAQSVHLGMAIAMRGGGLVAPAIHDADSKSVDELMAALRDLIERVRGGRLRSSELSDSTATLTSLGDMGVERVYGVIYPPQVALIGLGRVAPRPWAVEGGVVARQAVTATLAADHRASDGRVGALFLSTLERLLGDPAHWSN